jgi:hypothetical protein
MLKIIQRFGTHYSSYLQSEYEMAECFWKPYIGQTVGGVKEASDIQLKMSK